VGETPESAATRADASRAPRPRGATLIARIDSYERLVRLDKPIGTLLLLWPTLAALWLAAWGAPPLRLVLIFAMGTLLMRSAGCAFNDWADRKFDPHVTRTAQRPLAAGEIPPWEALAVAGALAFCAFLLVLGTNVSTIQMSLPALVIAIVYPFTKRFLSLPQAFLGLAFSFGIPMAYAAVYGEVPLIGWWLFGLNVLWVIAYDTEYAMVDRDDDRKLGLRTSALFFGRLDVAVVMLCYAAYLGGMASIGRYWSAGPLYYAGLAVALGCALWHGWLIRKRDRDRCFRAFLHNHWLGFAVFAGIAADFAYRAGAWPRML
jgi:4-hydroxybenzoate polyprenyltransferase